VALAGTAVLSILALALIALNLSLGPAPWSSAPGGSAGAIATPITLGGGPLEGHPAPAFTLLDASGRAVSLAAYRGRPVIVNFWASWCLPCKAEFPLFVAARQRYGADGLEILGVVYNDSPASAAAFMAGEGASWPMLLDPQHAASAAYGVQAVPESFYIDAAGIVRTLSFGPPPAAGLDRLLEQIVARPSLSPVGSVGPSARVTP
jgi:cytochrome c biogenesis protein CcmG/thiol:disulfide interchange protein DsbE